MADDDEKPPQTAEEYFYRGNKRREKGDFDGAIADYSEAIRLNPDNAIAWCARGAIWGEKGDYDKALADSNEALRLKPDYVKALNNRGNVWCEKDKYDEAIADFDEAIRLKPDHVTAWNNRGVVWKEKGEYDKAMADFDKAINLKSDYAEAWSNRGNIWLGKGESDKAIADYDEAIRLNPKLIESYHGRGAAVALKFSKTEREEVQKRLEKEYEKRLKQELEAAVGQITTDTKAFRKEEEKNMCLSGILRILSIFLLVSIACVLFLAFKEIYRIETQGKELEPVALLSWLPAVTTISTPFFLLWWMLQRWSFELKTLAYGFQRKAIVEERILLYFRNEPERLKKMQEIYLVHWMEKSPLEVMLAIGGKSKGMGGSSLLKDLLPKFMSGVVDSQK